MPLYGKQDEKEDKPTGYWTLEMNYTERKNLLRLVDESKMSTHGKDRIKKFIELAPYTDLPLPESKLDWGELEGEAARQGVDSLEVWYDRTRK